MYPRRKSAQERYYYKKKVNETGTYDTQKYPDLMMPACCLGDN